MQQTLEAPPWQRPCQVYQKLASTLTICTNTVFMVAKLSTTMTVHTQLKCYNLLKFTLSPEEEEDNDRNP